MPDDAQIGGAVRETELPFATLADKRAFEAANGAEALHAFTSTLDVLRHAAETRRGRRAASFQLTGKPDAKLFSVTFDALYADVLRAANGLHALGVRPGETVAVLLPNLPETLVAQYACQAIGAVNPINPLLEPEIIAKILDEAGASVLITLAPFPKTDVAERAAEAAALSRGVRTIVEIDMARYLPAAIRLLLPALRPRRVTGHGARVVGWSAMLKGQPADRLAFDREITLDAVGAYFHTGGTTGAPKLAQHNHRGMLFNAWMTHRILFDETDTILCALPLFHVFAAYPMALCALISGAHLVLTTPAGFRGDGVVEHFWKLVERHRASFFCAVPTAIAALDQKPINADVSTLRYMISGSAPLPQALFQRFEKSTGLKILEGYGMTEATCVTSCNPPHGERRIGSVGLPMPFIEVRICQFETDGAPDADAAYRRDCAAGEIGEICFKGPCVFPGYTDEAKNAAIFFDRDAAGAPWLRTGDLGRVDAEGYIWITGRAKDVIIRGGHNIDPGLIEEALAQHPAVAFVGAIGQPDSYAGEIPCAYVELKEGRRASPDELKAFASEHVGERAARPAHVEVVAELPKTTVGKIYKPELRRAALARVYAAALAEKGVSAEVSVEDDAERGMIAVVRGAVDEAAVSAALSGFSRPWRMG